MGQHTAIKKWGSILSGLVIVGSPLLGVMIQGFEWQWVVYISVVIFCGFTGWWVYGYYQRVQQLEDARPSYEVCPKEEPHRGVLIEVINNGEEGEFEAQIEASNYSGGYVPPEWHRYDACWENEQDRAVTIKNGMRRHIKLATREVSPIGTGSLMLSRMTPTGVCRWSTHSYFILQVGGNPVIPEICLKVTISSSPSPKHGPVTLVVKLNAKDSIEILPTSSHSPH